MLHTRVSAAAAALILTLSAAGTALAVIPGTLDQAHECAVTDCNTADAALYPSWNSQNGTDETAAVTLGQTFTAGRTGPLTAVSLYLAGIDGSPAPATLTVAVVNVDGSGNPIMTSILAAGTIATAGTSLTSSMTPGWFTLAFSTPPSVTSGHKYAIVLGGATQTGAWMRWAIDSTNAGAYTDYAGGEAMAASKAQAASTWAWTTMNDVLTDGGQGTADFGFRTYVGAAATPTATLPSQPPTDTLSPRHAADGTGAIALVGLLAVIAAAALFAPSRIGKRRRS